MLIHVKVEALPDRQGPQPAYTITQCAACSRNPDVFVDETRDPHFGNLHELQAGRHEITVFFDRRDRVALSLSVITVHES